MTALLLLGVGLVVLTKAMDCLSTLRAVRSPEGETTPLARALMRRLGVGPAIGVVFALAALWSAAPVAVAIWSGSLVIQGLVAAQSVLAAVVQCALAHTNWTGRWNGVTRSVLRVHRCRLAAKLGPAMQ